MKKVHSPILRRRGLSLVETMLASGMFLMATGLVLSATFSLQYATRQEKIQNELERRAGAVIDNLQRDANAATAVESSYMGYETGNNSIVLKIPVFDANEVPIPDTYSYAVYSFVEGDNAVERLEFAPDAGDSPETTASKYRRIDDVSAFQILYNNLDIVSLDLGGTPLSDVKTVEVLLSLETQKDDRTYSRDFASTATIRNRL